MFHQNRLFPALPIVRNYKGGTYGLETSSFSIMWLKLYERERYLKGERSHNEIFRHLGLLVRAVGRLGGGADSNPRPFNDEILLCLLHKSGGGGGGIAPFDPSSFDGPTY